MTRTAKPYSEDELKLMRAWSKLGYKAKVIAKRLGRPHEGVQAKMRKLAAEKNDADGV